MSKKLNLKNQKFGKLLVLKEVGKDKWKHVMWKCLCDCGNTIIVVGSVLKSGNTKSCGCSRKIDLVGKQFGRLLVLEEAVINRWGHVLWKCLCSCGSEIVVSGTSLKSRNTKSCGCLHTEGIIKQNKSRVGKDHPNFGKKCPAISKGMCGKNHPFFGKKRSIFGERMKGKNNPNWKGGKSFELYCPVFRDKEWREYIYERDKNKFCWNPQCNGVGKKECLHHIDYDKKNCDFSNIIKVCDSCNSVANFNREWWETFYKEIMRRRCLL